MGGTLDDIAAARAGGCCLTKKEDSYMLVFAKLAKSHFTLGLCHSLKIKKGYPYRPILCLCQALGIYVIIIINGLVSVSA